MIGISHEDMYTTRPYLLVYIWDARSESWKWNGNSEEGSVAWFRSNEEEICTATTTGTVFSLRMNDILPDLSQFVRG